MEPVDVKEAATPALHYLKELYSEEKLENIRLEEVWLSEDERYWYVTIGYDSPLPAQDPLAVLRPPAREYKLFKVRTEDGRVVKMKVRQP
jgi:hypothetical protein